VVCRDSIVRIALSESLKIVTSFTVTISFTVSMACRIAAISPAYVCQLFSVPVSLQLCSQNFQYSIRYRLYHHQFCMHLCTIHGKNGNGKLGNRLPQTVVIDARLQLSTRQLFFVFFHCCLVGELQ